MKLVIGLVGAAAFLSVSVQAQRAVVKLERRRDAIPLRKRVRIWRTRDER